MHAWNVNLLEDTKQPQKFSILKTSKSPAMTFGRRTLSYRPRTSHSHLMVTSGYMGLARNDRNALLLTATPPAQSTHSRPSVGNRSTFMGTVHVPLQRSPHSELLSTQPALWLRRLVWIVINQLLYTWRRKSSFYSTGKQKPECIDEPSTCS